jgi:hypothetical protein
MAKCGNKARSGLVARGRRDAAALAALPQEPAEAQSELRGSHATPRAADTALGIWLGPRPSQGTLQCPFSVARTSLIDRGVLAKPTRIAVYGPVCTMVWQGSAGDRCPYADQCATSSLLPRGSWISVYRAYRWRQKCRVGPESTLARRALALRFLGSQANRVFNLVNPVFEGLRGRATRFGLLQFLLRRREAFLKAGDLRVGLC